MQTNLFAWRLAALRLHLLRYRFTDRSSASDPYEREYGSGNGYAIAGFLFAMAYPRSWKTAAVPLIVGAVGFELLQEVQPTRHARIDDTLIEPAGSALGIAIGHLWNRALQKQ